MRGTFDNEPDEPASDGRLRGAGFGGTCFAPGTCEGGRVDSGRAGVDLISSMETRKDSKMFIIFKSVRNCRASIFLVMSSTDTPSWDCPFSFSSADRARNSVLIVSNCPPNSCTVCFISWYSDRIRLHCNVKASFCFFIAFATSA